MFWNVLINKFLLRTYTIVPNSNWINLFSWIEEIFFYFLRKFSSGKQLLIKNYENFDRKIYSNVEEKLWWKIICIYNKWKLEKCKNAGIGKNCIMKNSFLIYLMVPSSVTVCTYNMEKSQTYNKYVWLN